MINTNKFLIPFSIPILVKISIIFLTYFLTSQPTDESFVHLFVAVVLWGLWILYIIFELMIFVCLVIKIAISYHHQKKDNQKLIGYGYGFCTSLLVNFAIYLNNVELKSQINTVIRLYMFLVPTNCINSL